MWNKIASGLIWFGDTLEAIFAGTIMWVAGIAFLLFLLYCAVGLVHEFWRAT